MCIQFHNLPCIFVRGDDVPSTNAFHFHNSKPVVLAFLASGRCGFNYEASVISTSDIMIAEAIVENDNKLKIIIIEVSSSWQ